MVKDPFYIGDLNMVCRKLYTTTLTKNQTGNLTLVGIRERHQRVGIRNCVTDVESTSVSNLEQDFVTRHFQKFLN